LVRIGKPTLLQQQFIKRPARLRLCDARDIGRSGAARKSWNGVGRVPGGQARRRRPTRPVRASAHLIPRVERSRFRRVHLLLRQQETDMASSSSHEPSVTELRRDADRTRAHLTGTVEELRAQVADTATHVRDAVSPATLKRQVKDYVRESSEDMVHSLQRRVRENPLQAVAIGAGLAYPLWNLLRAVPAPLLLIGAGLALSRSSTVREATDEALARARAAAANAADMTREKFDELRDSAGSVVEQAAELASSTKDRVSAAIADTKGRATNGSRNATDSVKEGADAMLDRGSGALAAAGDKISDFAVQAQGTLSNTYNQAKGTLSNTYEQNPLLIAGIGVAVGALIASSLPATSAENRLFGDTSEKLRRRASEAAAEGLDAAKQAAEGVVEAASQQGLSPEGLSSAAADLTRKARTVAERGVEAALGNTPRSNSPSSPTT
jgi:ElaB/YqjD/DUF883 family membrane-anchored ribosome-binding protein